MLHGGVDHEKSFFPESVSEGSFLNRCHQYDCLLYMPFTFLLHFFIAPPLLDSFFVTGASDVLCSNNRF